MSKDFWPSTYGTIPRWKFRQASGISSAIHCGNSMEVQQGRWLRTSPVRTAAAPKNGVSKAPKIIYMSAFDGCACKPITVVANQTTTMKIGPPYTPTLTVVTKGKVATLALEVRGIGHEKVDFEVTGITQSKPKFKLLIPKAKLSNRATLNMAEAHLPVLVASTFKLAEEYQVHLDLDLGPFPVKKSGPIIIHKSQLEPAKGTAVGKKRKGMGRLLRLSVVELVGRLCQLPFRFLDISGRRV